MNRLRRLLKVAWSGSAPWSFGGDGELDFWLGTNFSALRSRMRHDAVRGDIKAWIMRPDGTVAKDIRVFAADTSETGSGGGEFFRDGHLWRMVAGTGLYIRLRDSELGTSSCLRECKGVDRLDLAVIPRNVVRAVVVCDAQAAIHVLEKGSSIPELQEVAVSVFKRQLRLGRILFFVWAARDEKIVVACDDRSRLVDNHAFKTSPAVFWKANSIAKELFGQDFQLDGMADMHNVAPPDCAFKLPFFSRWLSPFSSGVDALVQDWAGKVSWVNPPFPLLERIICLLRAQRVVAAVVVPLKSRAKWSSWACEGAEGVAGLWRFDPRDPIFAMRGRMVPQTYRGGYAVVFFDFRSVVEAKKGFSPLVGAQELRLRSRGMIAKVRGGVRAALATVYSTLGVAAEKGGGVVVPRPDALDHA